MIFLNDFFGNNTGEAVAARPNRRRHGTHKQAKRQVGTRPVSVPRPVPAVSMRVPTLKFGIRGPFGDSRERRHTDGACFAHQVGGDLVAGHHRPGAKAQRRLNSCRRHGGSSGYRWWASCCCHAAHEPAAEAGQLAVRDGASASSVARSWDRRRASIVDDSDLGSAGALGGAFSWDESLASQPNGETRRANPFVSRCHSTSRQRPPWFDSTDPLHRASVVEGLWGARGLSKRCWVTQPDAIPARASDASI